NPRTNRTQTNLRRTVAVAVFAGGARQSETGSALQHLAHWGVGGRGATGTDCTDFSSLRWTKTGFNTEVEAGQAIWSAKDRSLYAYQREGWTTTEYGHRRSSYSVYPSQAPEMHVRVS
ncbi:unnamed protein product, partial [Ectocarpus sp. 8 AP-2014]